MSKEARINNSAGQPEVVPILDLSDDPILKNAIAPEDTPSTESAAIDLAIRANEFLDRAGKPTFVDGDPIIATEESSPIKVGKKIVYARLARQIRGKYGPDQYPSIIFCTDPGFDSLSTASKYSPLTFRTPVDGLLSLVAGDDENLDSNSEKHISDATKIIDDLENQYTEKNRVDFEKKTQAEKSKAQAEIDRRFNRRQRVKHTAELISKVALISVVSTAALYGQELLNWGHNDAKIGAVPMPDFVEWFVDWNNGPDHTAQAFKEPAGALAIAPGKSVGDVPLLPQYKTTGVPNAKVESVNGNFKGIQSRPGLYKSYVTFNPDGTSPEAIDANGCYRVTGNFEPGKTEVFTDTINFNKAIQLKVVSSKVLEVCKGDIPQNFGFAGSFFLYQNH